LSELNLERRVRIVKLRILSLTLLCLVLAAVPASTQTLYDNGPINGTTNAWTINFGYVVSDTFTGTPGQTVTGFDFGVWLFAGDTLTSVDWSITSGENSGTVYGSGTATGSGLGGGPPGGGMIMCQFKSSNQYGHDIDDCGVSGILANLGSLKGGDGLTTYWLNLQNAAVPSGDPVYWDENSGQGCGGSGCPSMASESAVGTIASESFTIYGGSSTGTTPEPSSVMLFGSGILGLAGLLRRKLF
jgi:PEP-CTERM motif